MELTFIGTGSGKTSLSRFYTSVLITEATHITLNEIADAVKIINPKKCYLVHINDEELLKNKIDKLSAKNKSKFRLTYDGMFVIPKM